MVLYRLLKDVDPGAYCLISQEDYSTADGQVYSEKLPCRYYRLRAVPQLKRGTRWGLWRWRSRANLLLSLLSLGRQSREIAGILQSERCDALLSCTGNFTNMPAGYLASRRAGARFYAYIFDDYTYQWVEGLTRFLASRMEPALLKGASGVIVANEFMRDELHQRHGVTATVIHNPCDLSEYDAAPIKKRGSGDDEISIVYTGAIYQAQLDALQNLVTALDRLGRSDIRLHVYTAQQVRQLSAPSSSRFVTLHPHQPLAAMPTIQQEASILFLPLAFDSPYPRVIRTSAPGKIGEYLSARRPILVHAPHDSFLAWYFREHECGLVVDDKDPAKLAQAIQTLVEDPLLQQRLAVRAWQRAEADFRKEVAQAQFASLMALDLSDRSQQASASVRHVMT